MSKDIKNVYFPDNRNPAPVQYMCIAAHHDDIEIMATDGILKGQTSNGSFLGVVVTDGRGSARSGNYANYTDDRMVECRIEEQKKAAELGRYHAVVFLNHPSAKLKDPMALEPIETMTEVLKTYKPKILYTHNPFDKHGTHVKLLVKLLTAIRTLPKEDRPDYVYGVEVWRDLDWLPDDMKVVFDVTKGKDLTLKQLQCFDSQISGGKRYDLATEGRRFAHATFFESHQVDQAEQVIFGVDLTPLITDDNLTIDRFVKTILEAFKEDILNRLNQ